MICVASDAFKNIYSGYFFLIFKSRLKSFGMLANNIFDFDFFILILGSNESNLIFNYHRGNFIVFLWNFISLSIFEVEKLYVS